MRGLEANMAGGKVRINCVTPLWTATGIVPKELLETKLGMKIQGPEAVAKSAMLLMADESRRGQTIYSRQGRFKEMDRALLGKAVELLEQGEGDGPKNEEEGRKMMDVLNGKM